MDRQKKKLLRLGLILILLFALENWLFYKNTPKKKKTPTSAIALKSQVVGQKPSATPSVRPSVSPSISALPDPYAGLAAGNDSSPTPSASSASETPEEEFDDDLLINLLFNFIVALSLCLLAFLGYRWLLFRKPQDPSETDNSTPTETGVELNRDPSRHTSAAVVQSKEKPLPNRVFVQKDTATPSQVDAILIESDPAVLAAWVAAAHAKGKKLLTFSSVGEFMKKSSEISTQTDVFIDISLGSGILGGSRSKRIFDAGFKRIFLTTSDPLSATIPSWVAMIVSKNPPWA